MSSLTLLFVRLVVAFIFLWHGVPKALDPAMAAQKFVGFGLPGFLGPVIGMVEVGAAGLLVLGVLHRWSSLALAVVMVGALITVQIPNGVTAGFERDSLILVATLLLAVHGPGAITLARVLGKDSTAMQPDTVVEA